MFFSSKNALKEKNAKVKAEKWKKEKSYSGFINAVKYPSVFLMGVGNRDNKKNN